MKIIFKFDSYRQYLKHIFPAKGDGRGRRRSLAKFLNCQTSFISLVLTERAHLNEDMAFATTNFLSLNTAEIEFFLLIYHHERASTRELKKFYSNKINQCQKESREISKVIQNSESLPLEYQSLYYSDWKYSLIHTACMNKNLNSPQDIASHLGISVNTVTIILKQLASWGLIKITSAGISTQNLRVHLDKKSPFILQHHRNWHLEAIRCLFDKQSESLNYSGALSMAKEDYFHIHQQLLDAIASFENKIKNSKDEVTTGISISFYKY